MDRKPILAGISQGDINGIGYEVILKALNDPLMNDICVPVVYGSPKVAAYHRKALNINNFSFNNIRTADEANIRKANMINCLDDNVRVELGKSTPQGGEAAFISLERALEDLRAGKINVLITAPIDKKNIQSEKFNFRGHTDYLKVKTGVDEVLMFMISENMRIGFVTDHVPLRKVPELITIDSLLKKIRLMNQSLIIDFGIRKPQIAVLGLNPHAGEETLLGAEETEVIIPAISKAEKEGIMVFGPFPSDGFFGAGSFTKFDGIISMYHDQGLAPFKALSFDSGVNFTAGLPFVRTSPVHGTAFSIAGKGEASENSFRQAIYLACSIYRNRLLHAEIMKNPLKHQDIEIHSDKIDELPPDMGNTEQHL
ncbi:MAG TPA: 4-hydroxythreonine-4-phosphate dehydrogenase PdxA [Bacteroidales bacterium]|jgi:4-hydroxythreonine-4-phosphate dehydrogenase|nr:4-hydroxythreonine-4-phosphate dehydrogenase PdxA [Bacteroidales bacterium]OQB62286.1 MAG: 4-hydroxythreonine-4-phosphate dehydrogenase 2 [Bacteroidetes bacterium ADurb.Bin145]NMD04139.1 4-hydroxythreonine-4-phosphate dehydrogenase PdxA [Bacteroidales bacterium]HOU02828.1 4-hydroxythreonine-4-phosphate dehydrogenase PdxA [Bacteroidales bacterium]HQG63793.1 4-hydroxythreonine-4-phosphate dehydrogenase PdxA [Bacteroidales bacterium]